MKIGIFEAFCAFLYRKRWLLVLNFVVACAAGTALAFVIMKQEFSASVTFLPPAGDVGMSALSLMNLSMPSLSAGGATAEQVDVIFGSNALKRQIIDEFDFVSYFKLEDSPNKFGLASKQLKKYVTLDALEKGSFGMSNTISYSITCYHASPDTAKLMADFTFAVMDSTIREISINKAQRNRVFIESQLALQNSKMDSLVEVFQDFQTTNKAYDVPEQAKLSLKAYADLQAAALMNELRLSALSGEFRGATHEIAELRRNQRVYEAKLREFQSGENPNVIPSLDRSSMLFPRYSKMLRDIEVLNQLILLLTKELEQARLQEARDVSPLIIIDPPFVPEYKARPKRLIVLLAVVLAEHLFFIGAFTYFFYVKHVLKKDERFNAFVKSIKQG